MLHKLATISFAFLLIVSLGFGQTTMTSTTTSAAITSTQKVFSVASATTVLAPGFPQSNGAIGTPTGTALTLLVVDQEAMEVAAINSLTLTVKRGAQGTKAAAHVSGAKVWVGPAAAFTNSDPAPGSCTATALAYLPRVVITTGRAWNCGNGQWTTFDGYQTVVGAVLASAATIAPTNPIQHVSGTTTVNTITLPPACPSKSCAITIIPDGIFATGTSGNIAIASTSVVSKALIMTYDPGTAKWYPSY